MISIQKFYLSWFAAAKPIASSIPWNIRNNNTIAIKTSRGKSRRERGKKASPAAVAPMHCILHVDIPGCPLRPQHNPALAIPLAATNCERAIGTALACITLLQEETTGEYMSELEENFEVVYLFICCTMAVLGIYIAAAFGAFVSKRRQDKQPVTKHPTRPARTISTLP